MQAKYSWHVNKSSKILNRIFSDWPGIKPHSSELKVILLHLSPECFWRLLSGETIVLKRLLKKCMCKQLYSHICKITWVLLCLETTGQAQCPLQSAVYLGLPFVLKIYHFKFCVCECLSCTHVCTHAHGGTLGGQRCRIFLGLELNVALSGARNRAWSSGGAAHVLTHLSPTHVVFWDGVFLNLKLTWLGWLASGL